MTLVIEIDHCARRTKSPIESYCNYCSKHSTTAFVSMCSALAAFQGVLLCGCAYAGDATKPTGLPFFRSLRSYHSHIFYFVAIRPALQSLYVERVFKSPKVTAKHGEITAGKVCFNFRIYMKAAKNHPLYPLTPKHKKMTAIHHAEV